MSFLFSPGSLHEGDEIAEINGKSVANHTVDQLQKILVSFLAYTKSRYDIIAFVQLNMLSLCTERNHWSGHDENRSQPAESVQSLRGNNVHCWIHTKLWSCVACLCCLIGECGMCFVFHINSCQFAWVSLDNSLSHSDPMVTSNQSTETGLPAFLSEFFSSSTTYS